MNEQSGGKRLTSIKPKNQRLRRRVFSGLNEPVEESPPRVLIDRDIPSIVSERYIKALAREVLDLVQSLLDKWMRRRRSGCAEIDQSEQDLKNKNPFQTRHFWSLGMEQDEEEEEMGVEDYG